MATPLPRVTLYELSQSQEGGAAQSPRTPPDYDVDEVIMTKIAMKLMRREVKWVEVKVRTQDQ